MSVVIRCTKTETYLRLSNDGREAFDVCSETMILLSTVLKVKRAIFFLIYELPDRLFRRSFVS